jgi:serine/threonine protein kinase
MSDLPEKIGKYPVIGTAGHGNMGVVYTGHDPFHDRDVAIKVCRLSTDIDANAARVARKLFFNEAHMAGVLDHPNITRILDAGEENDEPYIVMEFVDGGDSLAARCKADRLLPIPDVADIVFKCAKALDYAHRRGVIHRDIKPSNLMLTADGDVKIGDFGVAHLPMGDDTHVMGIMGSPNYMSPEQIQDEELTSQTDLYSLGVVMYELLTGKLPFQAKTFPQLARKIINEPPPPLESLRPDLPEEVVYIVRRALAKSLSDRYQTGSELASDLMAAFPSLAARSEAVCDEENFRAARKLDLFNEFADEELREVLSVGDWQDYGPGETIITEGSAEYSLCILVTGDVAVRKRGQDLTSLTSGDCFGEMGYLSRTRRTASIVALNDVALLRLNEAQIDHASDSVQNRFNRVFLQTLVKRLERTSDELSSKGDHYEAKQGSARNVIGGVLTGMPSSETPAKFRIS